MGMNQANFVFSIMAISSVTVLVISFIFGFYQGEQYPKSEMLADMQPLLMVISKSRDDFWFMQTLLERTTDDKYLRDAVNDCIERMKFRKPMFEKALAEFNAKYKDIANGKNN